MSATNIPDKTNRIQATQLDEETSPYPVLGQSSSQLTMEIDRLSVTCTTGSLHSKTKIRINDLKMLKARKERWAMLTTYDVMTARIFDMAKIPCLLVGDSAANVHMGCSSTISITLDDMILFTKSVARGVERALLVADLPFGSYQSSPTQAVESAVRLMKEAGAEAVKLEGGSDYYEHVKHLTRSGIPVIAHIGFTPQYQNLLSGYKVQGRDSVGANRLIDDALRLQEAGAFACVLEMVPSDLAKVITEQLDIPTVGIGAGPHCDAQVLVWQDMAGFVPPTTDSSQKLKVLKPKFVKQYCDLGSQLLNASKEFYKEVQEGTFPASEHSFL